MYCHRRLSATIVAVLPFASLQMISRDSRGDRIAYGAEADWWSFGCLGEVAVASCSYVPTVAPRALHVTAAAIASLVTYAVYCLMTGRSPFSSGMGTSHDNALSLEGRISWPRGVFSRDAKDLITRLLCVDPRQRLGSGPHGWSAVMNHPWFGRVDWALLEAKVLPAPSLPGYRSELPARMRGMCIGPAPSPGENSAAIVLRTIEPSTQCRRRWRLLLKR